MRVVDQDGVELVVHVVAESMTDEEGREVVVETATWVD